MRLVIRKVYFATYRLNCECEVTTKTKFVATCIGCSKEGVVGGVKSFTVLRGGCKA